MPSTSPKKKSNIVGTKNIINPINTLLAKLIAAFFTALSSPLNDAFPKSMLPSTINIIGTNIFIISVSFLYFLKDSLFSVPFNILFILLL